jgi:predicted metal-dependent peptidase
MDTLKKFQKARAGLILDHPFFGSLALRQTLKEDPTCETAWTDGKTMGFNPDFIEKLTLAETKGLIAHEVMHVAAAHNSRRNGRNKSKWNKAGDYAINDMLIASGFVLPASGLVGFGSEESADSIYSKLPDPEEKGGGQGPAQNQSSDPGGSGEVRDAPGKDGQQASSSELAQAEADSKIAVAQAVAVAKSCGKLPAGMDRMLDDILNPKVPWREVLRRFIDQAARNDYTWTRPAARYLASGIYLPSLYSKEMNPIVIAVDTSGSIGAEEIGQFASEMNAIIEDTRVTATVIYCDAAVAGVEEFNVDNLPLVLHPAGGGGTSFIPPFEEAENRQIEPACLIYLTDGLCHRFPPAPAYPVLWGLTGNLRAFNPPFGETIIIE